MTPQQYAFVVGIAAIALAMIVALALPQRARVLKADREPPPPRVVRVIPLDRQGPPKLAAAEPPQRIATDIPQPDAEPPPLNEKDLLEPGQAPPELEPRRQDRHVDICSRHGGRRIEFKQGRRLVWRCVHAGRR